MTATTHDTAHDVPDGFVEVTIDEAMKILNVSRPSVRRMISDKLLKGRKVGNAWQFIQVTESAYRAYHERLTNDATSAYTEPTASVQEAHASVLREKERTIQFLQDELTKARAECDRERSLRDQDTKAHFQSFKELSEKFERIHAETLAKLVTSEQNVRALTHEVDALSKRSFWDYIFRRTKK